jgi:hypothetical protein
MPNDLMKIPNHVLLAATEVMEAVLGRFGRYHIQHRKQPHLAWSGRRWNRHDRGIPCGQFQICNFATEAEARKYIKDLAAGAFTV